MMKFHKCRQCGQIVLIVKETNVPFICCGEVMEEIEPCENEEKLNEKHVPVYKKENGTVTVDIGSIPHPMTKEHYIEWVTLTTDKGDQRKCLKPGDAPKVTFHIDQDEKVKTIFAYCNIHSLWKLAVNEE